jgi:hypothetical protein
VILTSVCNQPGDPAKAAAVIIHIASLDEPPLRLQLGSDAVHQAEQSDLARTEADRKKWRDLSVSTDLEVGGAPKVYPWERKMSSEEALKSPRRLLNDGLDVQVSHLRGLARRPAALLIHR